MRRPARFAPDELSYLRDQRLGRLATVDEQHAPQVVPVGFFVDAQTGDVSIGGTALGSTRKFRNVEATGRAALVVGDVASADPWRVRGVEICGRAEACRDVDPPRPGLSREPIMIHLERIRIWGCRSMSADDKLAGNDVLVGYFHGFDERRTDDAFLQASFTADAHWRFPRGEVTGLEQIIERRDPTLGL